MVAVAPTLAGTDDRATRFDGVDDHIELPPVALDFTQGLTVEVGSPRAQDLAKIFRPRAPRGSPGRSVLTRALKFPLKNA